MRANAEHHRGSIVAAACAERAGAVPSRLSDPMLEAFPDAVFVVAGDGQLERANRLARPLIETLSRRRSPADAEACTAGSRGVGSCLSCVARGIEGGPCDVAVDGRVFELRAVALPAHERAGARLVVGRDVTETRIEAHRQARQERLAVLGEVAAVVVHELNNPISAIAIFSDLMLDDLEPGSTVRTYADVVRRNARRCQQCLTKVLELASNSAGEVEAVDLALVVEEVVELLEPLARRAGVTLVGREQVDSCLLTGRPLALRQATMNLVLNALHAVEASAERVVSITTFEERDQVGVRVSDTGSGIAADLRGRIFEPFFTTRAAGRGTGLGLPTAQRIAIAHGGRVLLVRSEPGGGSVFELRLGRGAFEDAAHAVSR